MRVWRGVVITALGQKTPMFVAYRRLERGAIRYRSLSLPSGVSIACGIEDNLLCQQLALAHPVLPLQLLELTSYIS